MVPFNPSPRSYTPPGSPRLRSCQYAITLDDLKQVLVDIIREVPKAQSTKEVEAAMSESEKASQSDQPKAAGRASRLEYKAVNEMYSQFGPEEITWSAHT